jgi:hypothetical protein
MALLHFYIFLNNLLLDNEGRIIIIMFKILANFFKFIGFLLFGDRSSNIKDKNINIIKEKDNNMNEPIKDEAIKEKEEILKIISINDEKDIVPKRRSSTTGKSIPLDNIKALVVHWTAAPGQKMLEETIPWMIYQKKESSYNYAITEKGEIVEMCKPPNCSIHAGAVQYTRFATEYFGSLICPTYIHTKDHPHLYSPNSCTLSLCMAILKDKTITDTIFQSLITCAAYMYNKYTTALEPIDNTVRHSDLTDQKAEKCPYPFFNDENMYHRFKDEVEKKRTRWLANYPGRGYPTLDITTIELENPYIKK